MTSPAFGPPGYSLPGDTPYEGVDGAYARAGHRHGREASGGGNQTWPQNFALNKPYTLSPTPNASYPDATDTTSLFNGSVWTGPIGKLTDGQTGGTYTSGQNCGWLDPVTAAVCRIDLGSNQVVTQVLCRGRHGFGSVYRPIRFLVESSPDDSTYTSQFDSGSLADGGQPGDMDWLATLPISSVSARYWRVTITRSAVNGHWLFVNEIEVRG